MSMMSADGRKIMQVALHEDNYQRLRKLKFALEKDSFDEVVKTLLDGYEREATKV